MVRIISKTPVDKNITRALNTLEKTITAIKSHPDFSLEMANRENMHILQESRAQSLQIENIPVIKNPQSFSGFSNSYMKEAHKKYQSLLNAECLLKEDGISIGTISKLGYLLEPEANKIQNFRTTDVAFGQFFAPKSHKVPYLIEDLLWKIETLDINPVLSSIEGHIGTIDIHPYVDGNGRASRIIQNQILSNNFLPASVIPVSEKDVYIALMAKTIGDRRSYISTIESPSENEKLFQKYLISKVLDSAYSIYDSLEKKREHELQLFSINDSKVIQNLARRIRNQGKRTQKNISVRTEKGKNPIFHITGDLSHKELEKFLEKQKGDLFKSFKIN
jgi:hypothetical protein